MREVKLKKRQPWRVGRSGWCNSPGLKGPQWDTSHSLLPHLPPLPLSTPFLSIPPSHTLSPPPKIDLPVQAQSTALKLALPYRAPSPPASISHHSHPVSAHKPLAQGLANKGWTLARVWCACIHIVCENMRAGVCVCVCV